MVKIRLKRMGTTKRPFYRLVVADSRSPRDGRFIESIGFYDPLPEPAVVRIDAERVKAWMVKGARPSDSARDLLIREGILAASARPVRPPRPATSSGPDAAAARGSHDDGAAGDAVGAEPAEEANNEERRGGGDPEAAGPAAPADVAAPEPTEQPA